MEKVVYESGYRWTWTLYRQGRAICVVIISGVKAASVFFAAVKFPHRGHCSLKETASVSCRTAANATGLQAKCEDTVSVPRQASRTANTGVAQNSGWRKVTGSKPTISRMREGS